MSSILSGVKLAVVGGDDRESYLVAELLQTGAEVNVVGLPDLGQHERLRHYDEVKKAVRGVRFLILPMPGIDQKGQVRAIYSPKPIILDDEVMGELGPQAVTFVGIARPRLQELADKHKIKLIELAEMDEIAILNSIPSAEGAIQMAMELTPITIHSSRSLVLGFGRTGKTLARTLAAMGADVAVVARKPADLARAYEMGFDGLTYAQLPAYLKEIDVAYNTVPIMVLSAEILKHAKPGMVVVDLASAPGGTDFEAAQERGIKAVLAPGLPGKVAPKTAGLILAKVIPGLIQQEMALTANAAGNGSGN